MNAKRYIRGSRLERRLIAIGVLLLGVYNLFLAMFPAPLAGFGQIEDELPMEILRGSRFGLVILGITLIILSRGLWHGKKVAWLGALGCTALTAALHPLRNLDFAGTVLSLVLFGALLGARPQFPARSDPPTALRGLAVLLTAMVAAFAYSTLGLYTLDSHFRHSVSLTQAVLDSVRLLLLVPATQAVPVTHHGSGFVDSARIGFLAATVLGVMALLRPVVYRSTTSVQERERVESILQRFGGSSLAFFALLPDKSYFFSEGGNAVLAYGVAGNSAIVMGDPIGETSEYPELLQAFSEHCELNGWAYAFNQARPEMLSLYSVLGLRALKTGEEGIVDVQSFTLSGTPMKHLRATVNRLQREGCAVRLHAPPHDEAFLRQLRAVSDEWLRRGERRERTFMLGYFAPALLQRCEILTCEDASGRIAGFANILPAYQSQEATFDLLRYGEEPKGVADFLLVSMIEVFKERGFQSLNVGLAPFSGLEAPGASSAVERAMRLLYRHGSFLLRYQGLRRHKSKFATQWQPRYLVYRSESELPGVALATMRLAEQKHRRFGFAEAGIGDEAKAPSSRPPAWVT